MYSLFALLGLGLARVATAATSTSKSSSSSSVTGTHLPTSTYTAGFNPTLNPFDPTYYSTISSYDSSLISQCSSSYGTILSEFFADAPVYYTTLTEQIYTIGNTQYTVADGKGGSTVTTLAPTPTTYAGEVWIEPAITFNSSTAPVSSPCCLDCTVFGDKVQVYYWPTSTVATSASTITPAARLARRVHSVLTTSGSNEIVTQINGETITLMSPSVYLQFGALFATDLCGNVGTSYSAPPVMSFAPGELSTAMAYEYVQEYSFDPYVPNPWVEGNWADAETCSNITSSFFEIAYQTPKTQYHNYVTASSVMFGLGGWSNYIANWTITYNPCLPTLSVPTQLYTIDSQWKSCKPGMNGFYDPPTAVTSWSDIGAAPTVLPATTTLAIAAPTDMVDLGAIFDQEVYLASDDSYVVAGGQTAMLDGPAVTLDGAVVIVYVTSAIYIQAPSGVVSTLVFPTDLVLARAIEEVGGFDTDITASTVTKKRATSGATGLRGSGVHYGVIFGFVMAVWTL